MIDDKRITELKALCETPPERMTTSERISAATALPELLAAYSEMVEIAREIYAYGDAGGDFWWNAHDRLYLAAGIEVEQEAAVDPFPPIDPLDVPF